MAACRAQIGSTSVTFTRAPAPRLFTAVLVVEFRFGDRVVDVDRRKRQQALFNQLIQAVNAGGGFLGHAFQSVTLLGEPARTGGHPFLDLGEQRDFLVGFGCFDQAGLAGLDPCAEQYIERRVAAVVEYQVRALVEIENLVGIVPILFQRFALDGEDRNTRCGYRRRRVVLRREDVARGPANLRAQRGQGLDQYGGLDRHMQRSCDPRALQRLALPVFLAQRHQARHFSFGDIQLFAAVVGQRDVFYNIVGGHSLTLLLTNSSRTYQTVPALTS
jgi:hypothetical protein